jgi:DNA invertase Pin-like site-specific DNA recombinase
LADKGNGEDFERKMFQQLFEHADRHAIDVVVVWKIDRLARSFAQLVVLEEMLSKNQVGILSLTEPIDTTTSTGRFVFGIMASLARMENEIRRERISMGMRQLAREGKWGRARVPFGFKRRQNLQLCKVPAEAETVRLVFRIYRKRKSLVETARDLNTLHENHRGKPWTADRVRKVLVRQICTGLLESSGIRNRLKRLEIISNREFQQTRRLLAESRRSGLAVRDETRRNAIDAVFAQYFASLETLEVGAPRPLANHFGPLATAQTKGVRLN